MPPLPPSNLRGILAMCFAMAVFIGNDLFVKLVTVELPASQIMALRGLFVVAIFGGAVAIAGQFGALTTLARPMVLLRSLLEALVALAYMTALARMGIAELTALFLTAPLMMTAASAFMLKEQVGWRRWSAVVAGFVGMLIVVRPSPSAIEWAAVLGVLSAGGAVARDLITRGLPASTPSLTVSFGSAAAVALLGFALRGTGVEWPAPSPTAWAYLVASAILVAAGNYALILAFRVGEVSAVSPFRYSIMIWALAAGVLVWGDLPDAPTMIGAAIIVGSGLYIVHRERIRAREARTAR